MNAIFKKLNFKDQQMLHILDAPESFLPVMDEMCEFASIKTTLASTEFAEFVLAFVTEKKQIEALTPIIDQALEGDGTLWFVYPKKSSKNYSSDIERDTGWENLGTHGFEAVRMVAIDEDWSALRFRRVTYIKDMKRDPDRALTQQAKEKLKK